MQEFYGFEVVPGKDCELTLKATNGFHLSCVSIPHGGKGRSTLLVSVDGKSFALATLDTSVNILQTSVDLIFNAEQKVVFRVKGSTTLHCCGYQQEMDSDMFDELDDEEDDDEVHHPVAKMNGNGVLNGKRPDPTQASLNANEDEEDDEEFSGEEMDDLEDEEMDASDEEMDDLEDEEDEEDDEEMEVPANSSTLAESSETPRGQKQQQQQQQQKNQKLQQQQNQKQQQQNQKQQQPQPQKNQKQQQQQQQQPQKNQKQQQQQQQNQKQQQQQQKNQKQQHSQGNFNKNKRPRE